MMAVRIPVTPGTLSDLGYSVYLPEKDRQRIIREACKRENPLRIYRHLIARATQHKANPEIARILRKDAEWLKSVAYKGRSTWVLDPEPEKKITKAIKERILKIRDRLTNKPEAIGFKDFKAGGLIRVLKLKDTRHYPEFALYLGKLREDVKKALMDAGFTEEQRGKWVLRTDKLNIFVYG
jgi:hypothetical protein